MKIISVVGARPNFMKIAPIIEALGKVSDKIQYRLIHTGQHYDGKMSDVFLDQFNLKPDYSLNVGNGSPVSQIASIIAALVWEIVFRKLRRDLVELDVLFIFSSK